MAGTVQCVVEHRAAPSAEPRSEWPNLLDQVPTLPTRIVHEHRVKLTECSRAVADSRAEIDCYARNIERWRCVKRQGGDSFKPRNHRSKENDPIVGVDAERLERGMPTRLCVVTGRSGRWSNRDFRSRARPEWWVNHHKLPGRDRRTNVGAADLAESRGIQRVKRIA